LARGLVVLHAIRAESPLEQGRQCRHARAGASAPRADCP
jgi:hypothetical protein